MKSLSPSQKWIVINVAIPLVPFAIGAMVRLLVTLRFAWNTFEGSEMAICLALLSFFIGQSLVGCHPILSNKDKREELRVEIVKYYILGAILLAIFALIEAFTSEVNDLQITQMQTSLHILQMVPFALLPLTVIFSTRTQRTYRLTAKLT